MTMKRSVRWNDHLTIEDVLDVTCAGLEESKGDSPVVDEVSYEHDLVRTLDAIYLPDDGDETKSFIWVQYSLVGRTICQSMSS